MSDPEAHSAKRPSRWLYLAGAVLIIVGIAVFAVALRHEVDRIATALAGFDRFVAPGEISIDVAEPDELLVYFENRGEFEGEQFDTLRKLVWPFLDTKTIRLTITGPDGSTIAHQTPRQSPTYNRDGRQGAAIWEFDALEPGTYRINATWATIDPPIYGKLEEFEAAREAFAATQGATDESQEPRYLPGFELQPVLLAVGPNPVVGRFEAIWGLKGAAAVSSIAAMLGVLVIILTFFRRHPLKNKGA